MRRLIYSQLPLPLGTLPPDRAAYLRHPNGLGKSRFVGSLIIYEEFPRAILNACSRGVRTRDHPAAVGATLVVAPTHAHLTVLARPSSITARGDHKDRPYTCGMPAIGQSVAIASSNLTRT
jgi:hypothetical protein